MQNRHIFIHRHNVLHLCNSHNCCSDHQDLVIIVVVVVVVVLGRPVMTMLDFSLGENTLSLFCSSLNSPPTEILWEKNSKKLTLNGSSVRYKTSQVVVNRTTSAYVSNLTMDGVLDDVVGEYSCTVVNTIGTSNTISTTIKCM